MVSMYTNRNCHLTNGKLFHSVCVYKVLISLVKFEDFVVFKHIMQLVLIVFSGSG